MEWRASASRVSVDEALVYVLTWYEGINLDALQTMRANSKWTTDPELIQRRRDRAYSLIRYAPIHDFVAGLEFSDDEEEEWSDDEEEEVDEEIDADMPPEIAAGALTGAATETATEVQADPANPSSSGAAE